jgi:hypothetical protein
MTTWHVPPTARIDLPYSEGQRDIVRRLSAPSQSNIPHAHQAPERRGVTGARISELCCSALDCLDAWPCAQNAVEAFFMRDLQPVFDRCIPGLELKLQLVI